MDFKMLVYMIFKQAFEDYNELFSAGVTLSVNHKFIRTAAPFRRHIPAYSIDEIQEFFKSDWCETLLCFINKDQDARIRQFIDIVLGGKEIVRLEATLECAETQSTPKYVSSLDSTYKRGV